MYQEIFQDLLREHPSVPDLFKRNLLKEYLQVLVLSLIYSKPQYQSLLFYGGSCLRHCFGLERLSEDLDFVDLTRKVSLNSLSEDLTLFFQKELGLDLICKIQKFRIYLKFPILSALNLAQKGESNFLFLKIEVFKEFTYCERFKVEVKPLFKFGKTLLVRTFDLSTLMATKLNAILYRKWEKTTKTGESLIKVKGRDFFDLMWYLQKGIKPNLSCLKEVRTPTELNERLLTMIELIDPQSIRLDLMGLLDPRVVEDLSKNLKDILVNQIRDVKHHP